MTKVRVALLLLSVLVASVSAADVSGNWRMSINAAGVPELVCTFIQKDERLEGSCEDAGARSDDKVELNDGKVDGDRVSWTWKVATPDAVTWTYAFMGTLDANGSTMKGVAKLSAGAGSKQNEVNFTATKR
jgi:hypothetical protein